MRTKLSHQVQEFHEKFGVPVLVRPTVPAEDRVRLRIALIAEEFSELLEACGIEGAISWEHLRLERAPGDPIDLPALADALADLDYVIEGTRLEFGINGAPIADLVHAANMAKEGGATRADGKIGKPPGWQAPDVAGELERQSSSPNHSHWRTCLTAEWIE